METWLSPAQRFSNPARSVANDVEMGHEASVSKISEDRLGLPMEYALELNRLIELQIQGAVG